jgi:hypothetical protein
MKTEVGNPSKYLTTSSPGGFDRVDNCIIIRAELGIASDASIRTTKGI